MGPVQPQSNNNLTLSPFFRPYWSSQNNFASKNNLCPCFGGDGLDFFGTGSSASSAFRLSDVCSIMDCLSTQSQQQRAVETNDNNRGLILKQWSLLVACWLLRQDQLVSASQASSVSIGTIPFYKQKQTPKLQQSQTKGTKENPNHPPLFPTG